MKLVIALIALAFWPSYVLGYLIFGGMFATWLLESWTDSPLPTWAVYVDIFVVVAGSVGIHYSIQRLIPGAASFFNFFKGTTSGNVDTSFFDFQENIAIYGKRSVIAYLAVALVIITVFGWALLVEKV